AAALMTRAESIGPAAGLSDRELGDRTRRRLLPVGTRQRRANQSAMDRTVFRIALAIGIVAVEVLLLRGLVRRFVIIGDRRSGGDGGLGRLGGLDVIVDRRVGLRRSDGSRIGAVRAVL